MARCILCHKELPRLQAEEDELLYPVTEKIANALSAHNTRNSTNFMIRPPYNSSDLNMNGDLILPKYHEFGCRITSKGTHLFSSQLNIKKQKCGS